MGHVQVIPFFESMGFKLPERKGIADFLQEVTSVKDQEQYWCASDSKDLFDHSTILSTLTM